MNEQGIRILFTGDLAPIDRNDSKSGRAPEVKITEGVSGLFRSADLRVTNLECPLTSATEKIVKSGPHLKADPESISVLTSLGIDIACLSNNHIRDYGDRGVIDTLKTCRENGIRVVGAGENRDEAARPLMVEMKGKMIAFLNFSESEFNTAGESTAGSNHDDPIHIWRSIREIKNDADFIIVIMHGGKEMHPFPTPYQVKLFRFIADQGVSAVIGHHSHVIGGFEIYHDVPLVYSLGNFIFDEEGNPPEWYRGALAGIILSVKGPPELVFHYITQENNALMLTGPPEPVNEGEPSRIRRIDEEQVQKAWDHAAQNASGKIAALLIRQGILSKIMKKAGLGGITEKERKYLTALSNRFRCTTHRNFTTESLKKILNNNP